MVFNITEVLGWVELAALVFIFAGVWNLFKALLGGAGKEMSDADLENLGNEVGDVAGQVGVAAAKKGASAARRVGSFTKGLVKRIASGINKLRDKGEDVVAAAEEGDSDKLRKELTAMQVLVKDEYENLKKNVKIADITLVEYAKISKELPDLAASIQRVVDIKEGTKKSMESFTVFRDKVDNLIARVNEVTPDEITDLRESLARVLASAETVSKESPLITGVWNQIQAYIKQKGKVVGEKQSEIADAEKRVGIDKATLEELSTEVENAEMDLEAMKPGKDNKETEAKVIAWKREIQNIRESIKNLILGDAKKLIREAKENEWEFGKQFTDEAALSREVIKLTREIYDVPALPLNQFKDKASALLSKVDKIVKGMVGLNETVEKRLEEEKKITPLEVRGIGE